MAEIPLCQLEDDHIVKRVQEEFGAGQTMQILHAHSSSLSSLPRCYFMHEFSVKYPTRSPSLCRCQLILFSKKKCTVWIQIRTEHVLEELSQ